MPILIRDETPRDVATIHDLTQRAFAPMPYADGDEQDLIDRLRVAGALSLSLVAEQNGVVVAQVTFSPATAPGGAVGWFTLGPVSVEPVMQKHEIGARLIRAGLERLRAQGAAGCILLGNPAYYGRFGFRVAAESAPHDDHSEFFQMLPLAGPVPEGRFGYHPAFGA